MAEMASAFANISASLAFLEDQEKRYQSIRDIATLKIHTLSLELGLLKNHTLSLKLGLQFLERFLRVSNNEDIKMSIKNLLFKVRRELVSLSSKPTVGSLVPNWNAAYGDLRQRMKYALGPETPECAVILPDLLTWDEDLGKASVFLLESLHFLSCKADLIPSSMKEKLLLLQALLTYIADTGVRVRKENEKPLTHLISFLNTVTRILYSCLVLMDRESLSNLLEKNQFMKICTVILRASKSYGLPENIREIIDNLMKLLGYNANSLIFLHESIESQKLNDKLKFLRTFLLNLPLESIVESIYLVTTEEVITSMTISILFRCYCKDMKEDIAAEANDAFSEVLDHIKRIQAELSQTKPYSYPETDLVGLPYSRETDLLCLPSSYPKTDILGFLDLFLGHLEELLTHRPTLVEIIKSQIEKLREDFDFLRYFLRETKEQHDEYEELQELWTRIVGLAYQAEYVIDFYLVEKAMRSHIKFSLSKMIERIELIKSDVKSIYDEQKYHARVHDVPSTSIRVPSQVIAKDTDEVVGFDDEVEKIMEYLFGGPKQLDVVSVVGMPGLGKTTLAKKIYEAPSVVGHFDVRVWCSVSETPWKRELLLNILRGVATITEEMDKLNDAELAAKLYQGLKGRRYLIVLDDMWNIEAWNTLVRSFSDDKNHSRILITSRIQNVVSQIKYAKVHPLRHFSEDESWKLFQKKLLSKKTLSEELLEVGKEIAHSCKRLPLSIVVIAGLLEKVEKSVHKWKQIEGSLNSYIFGDSENQCKAILEQSYNHLPDHLKSCFLYLGAFPKDNEVPVLKLKRLWIAEGFIENNREKSLEDVAEEYLVDLISRSLVTVVREKSGGGVKSCLVHDLLHDFCLEKAKEEGFLQVIHLDDWTKLSRAHGHRRVSIYAQGNELMQAIRPASYIVRSLLHTASKEYHIDWNVSFIFANFKLLRVLDLACISIGRYFYGIELLIHLRYLAIVVKINSIPSSLANLWNLQYLLVEANPYDKVVNVPESLWDMVNLRHLQINPCASFRLLRNRLPDSCLLENLESLSTPCFSCKEDAENLMRRPPNLRKLRCIFLDCRFSELDFPSQLVSLKVIFEGSLHQGTRCDFNFPVNLEKLSLSMFSLPWDNISKIGTRLVNLKVLKLSGFNWDYQWIVSHGGFPKLKYLKLSRLYNICKWIALEDSFPILEQLVLENCPFLDEIPDRFGEIPTLRKITMKSCRQSVDDSARRIQREQHEELLNEELKIYIYRGKPYGK